MSLAFACLGWTTKTAAARLVLRVIATSNPGVSEEHRVGFGTCEVLADPAPLCAYYIAIASYTSTVPPISRTGQPFASSTAESRLSADTIE
jgi:hypothetical protein